MVGAPTLLTDPNNSIQLELLAAHHFDFYFRIYGDAVLMQHVNQPLDHQTATDHFQQNIQASSQPQPRKLTYLISTTDAADYMGLVGLTWRPVSQREQAFVGVVVLPTWRRQRVAHRAKQLLIKTAFEHLGVRTVLAHCDVKNLAANRANEKLGFTPVEITHNPRKDMAVQVWKMVK